MTNALRLQVLPAAMFDSEKAVRLFPGSPLHERLAEIAQAARSAADADADAHEALVEDLRAVCDASWRAAHGEGELEVRGAGWEGLRLLVTLLESAPHREHALELHDLAVLSAEKLIGGAHREAAARLAPAPPGGVWG